LLTVDHFYGRLILMRYIGTAVSIALVIFLASSCGEEEEEAPTTGTVSGTVTFIGEPPEAGGEIQVSLFSILDENGRPAGPPDHYSEPFTEFTGQVAYEILDVSFGTYKLAAVGFEPPDSGGAEDVLGMYGFTPPGDMQPDPITVSEEQLDVTGIDIIADYAQIGSAHSDVRP
jgi:hypothetical protein